MSVKIKVSYECPQELSFLRHKLGTSVLHVSREPKKGRFFRAYIDLKPIESARPKDT